MTLSQYFQTEEGHQLISVVDEHAVFYLTAIYGDYEVVDSSGGCHQPSFKKHLGIRVRQSRNSRREVCLRCVASLVEKHHGNG